MWATAWATCSFFELSIDTMLLGPWLKLREATIQMTYWDNKSLLIDDNLNLISR